MTDIQLLEGAVLLIIGIVLGYQTLRWKERARRSALLEREANVLPLIPLNFARNVLHY